MLRVKLREAFLSTAKAGHLIAGGASRARLSQGPEEESDDLLLDMGCLAQLLQNLQVVLTDPVRDAQVRRSWMLVVIRGSECIQHAQTNP